MRWSWALLWLLFMPSAAAHSTAFETDPDPMTGLPEAPEFVRIRFTEPMDFERSFIGIFDEDLLRRDAGDAHVDPDDPTVVRVRTGNLIRGIYTVSYETYSSVDGHQERGSLPLTIGVPCGTCLDDAGRPASLAAADIDGGQSAARAVSYASVAALLGLAVFARYATRRPGAWGPAAAVAAAAATASAIWVQHQVGAVAGPDLERLLGLRVLAGTAAAAAAWRWGAGHPATLLAGAVAATALAGTGHGDRSLARWAVQSVHVVVLLAWVGGLLPAAWLLGQHAPPERRETMLRFSRIATLGVAVLVLSGALLGVLNLRAPGDLVGTPYGQAVLLKVALSAGLLALGARNHLRLRRGAAPWRAMRRDVAAEIGIAVVVVAVTGVLAGLSLPVDAPEPAPPHVEEAWWGDYLVRIEVTPSSDGQLRPGDHVQKVRIRDMDGRPVERARVEMGFTNRVLDIGAITAEARELGGGWYATRGTQLGAVGEWELEVLFQTPGSLVQREARFLLDLGTVGHVHGGVRISDPHFDSGYLDRGSRYERHFGQETVGSFEYHCHPHQWMQGSIRVDPDAPAPPDGRVTVRMRGDVGDEQARMYFEPRDVVVPPGTVVQWVNEGSAPHTATNVQWYAP